MSLVRTESRDHVATITIAPAGGLYDRALLDALGEAAAAVAADAADGGVRVVLLRADGDFGAGWAADADATPDGIPGVPSAAAGIEAVAGIPQPVIAALRGQVRSAALELALACDIRVAAVDARFALPDTQAGGVPRAGGTQRLPRAVGRAHALRLVLTGEEIDAAEAKRIGLVSAVVPSEDVDATARSLAGTIAARGPIATRLAKEAVHRGLEMPLAQALRYELDLTVLLQSTADRAEGVRAFAEKRPPRFIGR
ncbi:MAG: enoyl-CoA hydratase-related protein [Dehalococcoidia bacterium]